MLQNDSENHRQRQERKESNRGAHGPTQGHDRIYRAAKHELRHQNQRCLCRLPLQIREEQQKHQQVENDS